MTKILGFSSKRGMHRVGNYPRQFGAAVLFCCLPVCIVKTCLGLEEGKSCSFLFNVRTVLILSYRESDSSFKRNGNLFTPRIQSYRQTYLGENVDKKSPSRRYKVRYVLKHFIVVCL